MSPRSPIYASSRPERNFVRTPNFGGLIKIEMFTKNRNLSKIYWTWKYLSKFQEFEFCSKSKFSYKNFHIFTLACRFLALGKYPGSHFTTHRLSRHKTSPSIEKVKPSRSQLVQWVKFRSERNVPGGLTHAVFGAPFRIAVTISRGDKFSAKIGDEKNIKIFIFCFCAQWKWFVFSRVLYDVEIEWKLHKIRNSDAIFVRFWSQNRIEVN